LDFECVHREWEEKKAESEKKNRDLQDQFQKDGLQWELNKQEFIKERLEKNDSLDQRIKQFLDKKSEAVIDYFENVLSRSEYPDYFPQEFDIDYDPKNKILIVAYSLPDFESLPKIKEVKYVQSKDDFIESILNESAQRQLYDNMAYEVALRTIHELYQADAMIFLEMIVFNGWVESMDTAKGKKVNACILSVQANRKEFSEINLMNVEPKACFKSLKGVGSSKLSSLTPIAPILDINREDKRFISAYEVADELNASTNLAAMDWEDFEQLVRELFEKEFAKNGGEVKITQASRDGGVDAVAFDPDPIRGGKIVIQAKRYTNTVGVSAVRDLYGTLMNEGANKGILVTTADYGPDSYEFAKGKPLTLLNGSNLLSLLEKYGKKARIDLKAAKIELSDK
jgi:restriction system protein